FSWSADSKTMTFLPDDILAYVTSYTVEIAGSALSTLGYPLDGNGDGIGGDSWMIQFTTGLADMDPPAIIQSYPINGQGQIGLKPVLSIVYDELIESSSFHDDMVILRPFSGGLDVNRIAELDTVGDHSVIHVYATEYLAPSNAYILRILPGLEDEFGHTVTTTKTINFSTTGEAQQTVMIDAFDGNFTSYWFRPNNGISGQTTGLIDENTNYWENDDIFVRNTGSTQSMQLDYEWDPNALTWFIRLYLSGGAPQNVHFDDSYKLQAFVFGDGQGNRMRFAVDDATSSEVSPWYTINWYGWRLVSWDMGNDGTGTWIGDGVLDGSLRFDSFQFIHDESDGMAGTYFIDDLSYAEAAPSSAESNLQGLPQNFALLPNYPNPFNPWTNIPFTLPEKAEVTGSVYNLKGEKVAHLISGSLDAGYHVTRWNASDVSSGLYLIKLEANGISKTQKITVLK
ncbi:MAG: T9SS type A sorting domain-containing protein, partial [Candidatus Marinimicrobia bacterium]|nr:T9SS type A sorting domain-containing protein [Candidatus Neomarinimicrobiota bacterium]